MKLTLNDVKFAKLESEALAKTQPSRANTVKQLVSNFLP
jgi:hypothetical protein